MDLKLNDKAFFVTGGSKGIGASIVLSLLEEGAKVATCARNEIDLEKLKQKTGKSVINNLLTYKCDVLDDKAITFAIDDASIKFGCLDGVVANAGFGISGNVLSTSKGEWLQQYEVKMFSIINLLKASLPILKQSDSARVVIINGVTANFPDLEMAAVSSARSAVSKLANMLALELAPHVLVNVVNLGAIDTERQMSRYKKAKTDIPYEKWSKLEATRRKIPLDRFGQPDEVVPFVKLFLSPLSSYTTGTSVDISGGLNAK